MIEGLHCLLDSYIGCINMLLLALHFCISEKLQCLVSGADSTLPFIHTLPQLPFFGCINRVVVICLQARDIACQHQIKYNLTYWAEGIDERVSDAACEARELQTGSKISRVVSMME